MLIVSDRDLGTPEVEWLTWAPLREAPALDLPSARRLVVVAPHPDDEILGAAGLMRQAAVQGLTVEIVAVTDGEASHPNLRDRAALRVQRRHESRRQARRRLGLDPVVHHVALPDGGVGPREARLRARLAEILDRDAVCVSPWRHDGHPDHEATARASAEACRRTDATLVEYPVWAWHWATPATGLPVAAIRRVELSDADRSAKEAAIAGFESQIRPHPDAPGDPVVLPPAVVARFQRRFETFFVGGAG